MTKQLSLRPSKSIREGPLSLMKQIDENPTPLSLNEDITGNANFIHEEGKLENELDCEHEEDEGPRKIERENWVEITYEEDVRLN